MASLVLILIGMAVVLTNQQYQANTIKSRRVLSFHFIGLRAIADKKLKIPQLHIRYALEQIHLLIKGCSYELYL